MWSTDPCLGYGYYQREFRNTLIVMHYTIYSYSYLLRRFLSVLHLHYYSATHLWYALNSACQKTYNLHILVKSFCSIKKKTA